MEDRESPDIREEAARLYRSGYSIRQVAILLGTSKSSVGNWVQGVQQDVVPAGRGRGPARFRDRLEEQAAEEVDTDELDPQRDKEIEQSVSLGDPVRAACDLTDGVPAEWKRFGELVCPDFISPWQCGRLLYYLSRGVPKKNAISRVGINLGQFELWLARASNHTEPYATFAQLCSMAQASACITIQRKIDQCVAGWQALAWILERLNPEVYASHVFDDQRQEDTSFADIGEESLKRTALAYIVADREAPIDVEFVDLEELVGHE